MSELTSEPASPRWLEVIDVKGLSDDVRRAILEKVKAKLGFNEAVKALEISKGALHNYLHGLRKVPDEVVSRALRHLEEGEFREAVKGIDRLRAVGAVREDGSIDYPLILQAIALATRDEYLKQAILRFCVENFREDLKKMLGLLPSTVKLTWERGFEEFLVAKKKRRKVLDPETLAYYRNLFKKYLEGKALTRELVDYVVNHENKWLRNVFRHYVQYLFHKGAISHDAYGWLIEAVPSRSYKVDVRPYPINMDDLVKTMTYLRDNHELYYLVYRLMLEGGLRLSHALELIESFKPNEIVEINGLEVDTPRLVRFDERGFCRYYVGLREVVKPCEWAYFSIGTLRLLERHAGRRVARRLVCRFAKKHGLLLPKYIRKVAWRLMIRAMPREVARFVQSRFGELKVSEARYEDLLAEADEHYPKYLEQINELMKARGEGG
jgi:intergrase/recombinase